jgi:hypothetical protein
MIYNRELYRQATEIVNEINRINFEYSGKIPKDKIDKMGANLIVNFGIQLCEKQIGEKDNICDTGIEL